MRRRLLVRWRRFEEPGRAALDVGDVVENDLARMHAHMAITAGPTRLSSCAFNPDFTHRSSGFVSLEVQALEGLASRVAECQSAIAQFGLIPGEFAITA